MLNLTEEDQATYCDIYQGLAKARDAAIRRGDGKTTKFYRQQISALYTQYATKQIQEKPTLNQCNCPNCGYTLTLT